jgi:hypothetical protein
VAELKTKPTDESVEKFLSKIPDAQKREDCFTIAKIMQEITGSEPKMWGASIIGFGNYHYKYASGREGDWMLTGFAPRKQDLTLYLMEGFEKYGDLRKQLGKHRVGRSCLYIRRLSDIHMPTLKKLIQSSVKHMSKYRVD